MADRSNTAKKNDVRQRTSTSAAADVEQILSDLEAERKENGQAPLTPKERAAWASKLETHLKTNSGTRSVYNKVLGAEKALGEKVDILQKGISELRESLGVQMPKFKASEEKVTKESSLAASAIEKKSTEQESTDSSKQERTQKITYTKTTFSELDSYGRFVRSSQYLALNSSGELMTWAKNDAGKHSWQNAETTKNPPNNLRVSCLYQADNGKIYDAKGNEVKTLSSYSGVISSSLAKQNFGTLKEGIVSTTTQGKLNAYFHKGKHVVFTKGNPPGFKASNQSSKIQESKILEKKTEQGSTQSRQTRSWSKQSYHVRDRFGQYYEAKMYARKSSEGRLQVFAGKTSAGKDVWVDSTRTKFAAIYIHEGKAYNSKGQELRSISSGSYREQSESIISNLSFDKSGIGSVRSGFLNAYTYGGKKAVFVQGKPPRIQ